MGVDELARHLGQREGANYDAATAATKFVTFLLSVFHGRHPPEKVGARSTKELRTLAEALDALGEGNLPHLGDLLVQRFKALQQAHVDGDWTLASGHEIASTGDGTLATAEERYAAARGQLLNTKIDEARKRVKAGR
jgi:hypothetical protein